MLEEMLTIVGETYNKKEDIYEVDLTKQETEDNLLKEAKQGNEQAVNCLFEKYRNFVFLKAKNYFLMGAERDDLIQEGMIGLLKAIRGYDEDKLASFKTFASICIKRQLITAIKSANSQKNLPLNYSVEMEEEKDSGATSTTTKRVESYICYSPEEICLTKEQLTGLREYLKENLSDFEYKVFINMMKGYSYKDISDELGKNIKAIDNAIQRIKKKSELWFAAY